MDICIIWRFGSTLALDIDIVVSYHVVMYYDKNSQNKHKITSLRRLKLEALNHHGLQHGVNANVFKWVHKKGVEDCGANAKVVWSVIFS